MFVVYVYLDMVKRLEEAKKIRNSSNTFMGHVYDAVGGATRAAMVVNGDVNISSRAYSNVRGSSFISRGAYSPLGRRAPVSVHGGNRALDVGHLHGSLAQNGGIGDGSGGLDLGGIRRGVAGIGGGSGSATGANAGDGENGNNGSSGLLWNSGPHGSMRIGAASRGAGMGLFKNTNQSGCGTFGDGNNGPNVKMGASEFVGNGNGNFSGGGQLANQRMSGSGIGGHGNVLGYVPLANHRINLSGIGGHGHGNVSGHGVLANQRMNGSGIGGNGNVSGHVPLANPRINISGIGGHGNASLSGHGPLANNIMSGSGIGGNGNVNVSSRGRSPISYVYL